MPETDTEGPDGPGTNPHMAPENRAIHAFLQHERWRRSVALLCVIVASAWTLYLHYEIISRERPEPTRTEVLTPTQADASMSAVAPVAATAGAVSPPAPTPTTKGAGSSAAARETSRVIATSTWVQVAHTAILLLSCAVIFVALVWAGVSLSRERD
jgi:hypothetical protein